MTYDQAQSPRLGQKTPVEQPGLQILTISTLPEVARRGMVVWLADKDTVGVFDGTAWFVAGGNKTQTFIGAVAPAADNVGDTWFNTTNSALYVWMNPGTGLAWILVVDPATDALEATVASNHAAALAAVSTLADIVDGKITTYYDTVQPTGASLGDLWINQTTNRLYRYNGTAWIEVQDDDIVAAILAAGTAQSTADGKIDSYYQNEPPTGLIAEDDGDLWIDLNDNNKLWRWSGSAWIDVADARIAATSALVADIQIDLTAVEAQVDQKVTTWYQSTFPWADASLTHDADDGDLFFDTDDKKVWRWGGALNRNWVVITDPNIQAALTAASTAQSTADGKIDHYVSAVAPTAPAGGFGIGDIWTDTANGNLKKYWTGSAWSNLPNNAGSIGVEAVNTVNISDLAVTNAKIGNLAVTNAKINDLQVDKLTAGTGLVNSFVVKSTLTLGDASTTGIIETYNYASASVGAQFSKNGVTMKGGAITGSSFKTIGDTDGWSITSRVAQGWSGTGQPRIYLDAGTGRGTFDFITSGPMNIIGGSIDLNGSGITETGPLAAVTTISGGPTITGGTTISSGLTVTGGGSLGGAYTGGFDIAGGVVIQSGGLTAGGAVTLNSLADGGSNNSATGPKYCRVGASGVLYSSTTAPSTREMKHDIEDIEFDYRTILKLTPKSYRYNESPETVRSGFIAEEAHELGLGLWVGYEDQKNPDKPSGFDYDGFLAAVQLVNQEQQRQIDELRAMVQALTT